MLFLAVVQKGAPPQYITYEDLKATYPQILFAFFEKKMCINGVRLGPNNIRPISRSAEKERIMMGKKRSYA